MESMDSSKGELIYENSSVEYYCRRYRMVYGIEVAKVGDESESAAYGLARQTF